MAIYHILPVNIRKSCEKNYQVLSIHIYIHFIHIYIQNILLERLLDRR